MFVSLFRTASMVTVLVPMMPAGQLSVKLVMVSHKQLTHAGSVAQFVCVASGFTPQHVDVLTKNNGFVGHVPGLDPGLEMLRFQTWVQERPHPP
jgi:hypothetical protein